MSQKIWILHKINKKKNILNRNVRLLKSMLISMHSILECVVAWMKSMLVVLLRCNEAQVALMAAFRSSALLGLVSLIFFFSMRFRSGEFAGQSSTVTHGHWTSFWYLWQCVQVPSPAGEWNQHLHKACQQKEAWSALKCPGWWLHWLCTSEKQWTNTSRWHGCKL